MKRALGCLWLRDRNSTSGKLVARAIILALVVSWPVAAFTDRVTDAGPLLWVVKGANATVYLFGSFHLGKGDVTWLTRGLREKFESADSLWVETENLDNRALAVAAMQRGIANPAKNMTSGLSDDEIKHLDQLLVPYGLSAQKMMSMKKGVVGAMLLENEYRKLGYTNDLGVDRILIGGARYFGKGVHGLETVDQSVRALLPDNDADELAEFRYTIETINEAPTELDAVFNAWITGNESQLMRRVIDPMKDRTPSAYQRVLVRRNEAWQPQIERLINGKGTIFVVVGVGHLIGPDSIVAILRTHGFAVERVAW